MAWAESARNNVTRMAKLKYEQKGAPVYRILLYLAITDAGRRGRLAHGRARFLLR